MAGRPPKPTNLHLVRGTKSQVGRTRPKGGAEPDPSYLQDLTPAAWLPDSAKAIWNEIAPKLSRAKLLTELDVPELERICVAVARYRRMTLKTEEHMVMRNEETGALSISPLVLVQQMYANQAHSGMAKFGMNPADRSRVIVNPQADLFEDPADAFFAKRK